MPGALMSKTPASALLLSLHSARADSWADHPGGQTGGWSALGLGASI